MIKNLLIFMLFLMAFGCDSKQYFSVVVWNESDIKIKSVMVWDNGVEAYGFGVLPKDIFGVRDFMYTPLSENIKLTWTEYESGVEREVQVDMKGVIPEKYHDGTVHFSIKGPNEVTASFYFPKRTTYPPKPKK